MLHNIFQESQSDSDLLQGDILQRSSSLLDILDQFHPHYSDNTENKFFINLTQSCDLVRRGDTCNARYITLAPIKPLGNIFTKHLGDAKERNFDLDIPVCTNKTKDKIIQFLERVINNNEKNLFFIPQEPEHSIDQHCCAILNLPISIKSDHYKICLDARILHLNDEFRAKLGWSSGHIYSRVATEDFPKGERTQIINNLLDDAAVWIDNKILKQLKKTVDEWKTNNPGQALDQSKLLSIADGIPTLKEKILKRIENRISESKVIQHLMNSKLLTANHLNEINNSIISDPELSELGDPILQRINEKIINSTPIQQLLDQKALNDQQLGKLIDYLKNDAMLKEILGPYES